MTALSTLIPRIEQAGPDEQRYTIWQTAQATRQRQGESEIAWCNRTYFPQFPGIHLCGSEDEENRVFTVLSVPCGSDEQARALWLALRTECEIEGDGFDFLVDLNTSEGHEDDFGSNRQMLPRIAAICRAHVKEGEDAR